MDRFWQISLNITKSSWRAKSVAGEINGTPGRTREDELSHFSIKIIISNVIKLPKFLASWKCCLHKHSCRRPPDFTVSVWGPAAISADTETESGPTADWRAVGIFARNCTEFTAAVRSNVEYSLQHFLRQLGYSGLIPITGTAQDVLYKMLLNLHRRVSLR